MKLAVAGSRGLNIDSLEPYVPPGVTEIVSGGARGVDTCAAAYAQTHGLKLTVFLPEYTRYGRSAPCAATGRSSRMRTRCWRCGTEHPAAPALLSGRQASSKSRSPSSRCPRKDSRAKI